MLLFKPFPSLSRGDQLALSAPIDLASVRLSPAEALARAGEGAVTAMRLVQRGTAPAYIVDAGGKFAAVDARTGDRLAPLASGAVAASSPPIDYDQWIVHNRFDPYRPIYRIQLGDPARTTLYRSAVTGEPVQRTTAEERAWNWIGAVLHWVYFTPLRSSFTAWDRTVWIVSLIATVVAILGIVLGIIRTRTALRQRKPSLSFYRPKWMRWHHLLGLFTGVFVFTWILSGWLSMDHGRLFSRGQPTDEQSAAYRGRPLAAALAEIDSATLRSIGPASEIDFNVAGGMPILTAYRADGRADRMDGRGETLADATFARLVGSGIQRSWPGAQARSIAAVAGTDLYAHAEGWPASVKRVSLGGQGFPDIYIDGDTGRILTVMSDSRASYAWIYYALHTFEFPGLIERPLLRQILVLVPLLFGFLFSLTGVVIGWTRLRKSISN